MHGVMTVEPFFRIETDEKEGARGYICSLNAVYRIGGRKMAHVSIMFPSGLWGFPEFPSLSLPYLMPWDEFQGWLSRID